MRQRRDRDRGGLGLSSDEEEEDLDLPATPRILGEEPGEDKTAKFWGTTVAVLATIASVVWKTVCVIMTGVTVTAAYKRPKKAAMVMLAAAWAWF